MTSSELSVILCQSMASLFVTSLAIKRALPSLLVRTRCLSLHNGRDSFYLACAGPSEWACRACTYLNAQSNSACEICETPRSQCLVWEGGNPRFPLTEYFLPSAHYARESTSRILLSTIRRRTKQGKHTHAEKRKMVACLKPHRRARHFSSEK